MQNIATVSLPAVAIARLTAAVASLPGVRFAGVTYRTKESGELARRVMILGASYENVLSNSLEILRTRENIAVDAAATRELLALIASTTPKTEARKTANAALKSFQNMIGAERAAAAELFCSYEKSLAHLAKGEENPDYTKAGIYENICPGLKVSRVDGTFELCGLTHSKTVIEPGTFAPVNSSDKTIAKRAIEKTLPAGKYRTLALDMGCLESVRIGGNELDVSNV